MADKATLKAMVQSFYDAQKIRIETGNRLVANVRVRLGQSPGAQTKDMPDESQDLIKTLVRDYRRIADALTTVTNREKVKLIEQHPGVLADVFEFDLAAHYVRLLTNEEELGKSIARLVTQFPVWEGFLAGVKGCGPAMAAVIISTLDPHNARHVSSFWKYAGLDVAEDGRGRSRRAEHLVDVIYVNKDGKEDSRKSITFNPFLKTKLVGVLGASFLRVGSPYRSEYDGYKHRLESDPARADLTKGHRHNMAVRYMIKIFLKDLWVAWRRIEGLPVTPDYAEAKLGLKHGA